MVSLLRGAGGGLIHARKLEILLEIPWMRMEYGGATIYIHFVILSLPVDFDPSPRPHLDSLCPWSRVPTTQ